MMKKPHMLIRQFDLRDLDKQNISAPGRDELHVWTVACGGSRDTAHSALRRILSRYTGVPEDALRFGRNEHGKPYLLPASVYFNLSHSGQYAVIAVCTCSPVGIDIEDTGRRIRNGHKIAERVFLPEEAAYLDRLAEPERTLCFFRYWTRTESFLKAIGTGLSASFADKKIQKAYASWTVTELPAPDGYICSAAYLSNPRVEGDPV